METPSVPTTEEKTCCGCKDGCKCKKGKGLIITTIIMTVLAVAGVGFGVYGMIKANEKPETPKTSTNEASGETSETKKNPIISPTDKEEAFTVTETFGIFSNSESARVEVRIEDGEIEHCGLYKEGSDTEQECKITGLTGKVYKMMQTAHGHDANGEVFAFILEDGTVEYFPTDVDTIGTQFKIAGKLNIDGFVTDMVRIGQGCNTKVVASCGGGAETLFILDDGSFVRVSSLIE